MSSCSSRPMGDKSYLILQTQVLSQPLAFTGLFTLFSSFIKSSPKKSQQSKQQNLNLNFLTCIFRIILSLCLYQLVAFTINKQKMNQQQKANSPTAKNPKLNSSQYQRENQQQSFFKIELKSYDEPIQNFRHTKKVINPQLRNQNPSKAFNSPISENYFTPQNRSINQAYNLQNHRAAQINLHTQNYPLISNLLNPSNAVQQRDETRQIKNSKSQCSFRSPPIEDKNEQNQFRNLSKPVQYSPVFEKPESQMKRQLEAVENSEQNQPEGIKLNIRSQLIRRSRKYQISTNNAHKKYINCLKNLFYEALSYEQITEFQEKYIKLKSSRVFFFIILVYVKYRFSQELGLAVKYGFQKQMNERIKEYEAQIMRCNDFRFKNYRYEEIHQIEIALKAIEDFFHGNTSLAIQYLYRKEKHIIVKQNHFRTSLKFIEDLEKEFSTFQVLKICKPVQKVHYHKKIAHKYLEKIGRVHESENQVKNETFQQFPTQYFNLAQALFKSNQPELKNSQLPPENLAQIQQAALQSHDESAEDQYRQDVSGSQIIHDQEESEDLSYRNDQINSRIGLKNTQNQQFNDSGLIEQTIFPPIPPFFYLPEFDIKYGHLFRKFTYIKNWRQANQKLQIQDQERRKKKFQPSSNSVPSPLPFEDAHFYMQKRV